MANSISDEVLNHQSNEFVGRFNCKCLNLSNEFVFSTLETKEASESMCCDSIAPPFNFRLSRNTLPHVVICFLFPHIFYFHTAHNFHTAILCSLQAELCEELTLLVLFFLSFFFSYQHLLHVRRHQYSLSDFRSKLQIKIPTNCVHTVPDVVPSHRISCL